MKECLHENISTGLMFLWRISNHSTLDGRGGLFASARWHTGGRRLVYLAATPAGALVEILVHLELDPAHLPRSYQLLKAEAPDAIRAATIDVTTLPENWREDTTVSRTKGDEWLASGTSALLEVPSAILPETFNFLLNPLHPDSGRISVLWHRPYPYDPRLFQVSKP
jgi:RES domain-containing protein